MEFPEVSYDEWRQRVEQELRGADFERTLVRRTVDGLDLEPLYAADGPPGTEVSDRPAVGYPGLPPFVRGGRPDVGPGRHWKIAPLYSSGTATRVAELLREDVEGGTDGAWIRLDAAARLGRPGATAGADGLAAYTAADLREILWGVGDGLATIIVDPGGNVLPGAAVALAAADGLPGDPEVILGIDPLGSLAADGEVPGNLDTLAGEVAELSAIGAGARHLVASTLSYQQAGADAVQELAYGLATVVEYLRWSTAGEADLASAAGRIGLRLGIGRDVFVESAKLRAARLLWGHLMAACEVSDPPGPWLHAVTSPRTLAGVDPWTNMLRITTQTFAAVMGGADAITTLPFDAILEQPQDNGRQLARNTQLILAEESLLGRVADPAGGSYYVEHLTDRLARDAWRGLQRIEAAGGMAVHLATGAARGEIDATWERWLERLATRQEPVIGVSEFADLADRGARRLDAAIDARKAEVEAVGRPIPVAEVPKLEDPLAAARNGASILELSASRRREPRATVDALPQRRDAGSFEALRARAEELAGAGVRPAVLLVCLGPAREHRARATFGRNLFAAGGIRTEEVAVEGAGAMRQVAIPEELAAVCICGTDARYAELACPVAAAAAEAGAALVILAGRPGDLRDRLRAAGVDRFVHLGSDVHRLLSQILTVAEAGR